MVKKKKETMKRLHIELIEDIRKVVDKYLVEIGSEPGGVAYAMGFLSGATGDDEIAIQQLTYMLQVYFFAGVYYSHNYKFGYEYMTPKQSLEKHEADQLKRGGIKIEEKESKKKQDWVMPNYVG